MMKERVKFVLEWERRWNEGEGTVNVSALCREYGVSRECGHKWIARYRDGNHSLAAVQERSRRPHRSPTSVDDDVQAVIVEARKFRPRWGAVKLRGWLRRRFPGIAFPSASAIAAILSRRGLVRVARRRRRSGPVAGVSAPFPECTTPNAVWCVDFKGWFRTDDGERCYPLTITDAYSRFVLRCECVRDPDGAAVQAIFDSAFSEFGLPDAMRSDNGPPFSSTGVAGLTELASWWLQLGICLQRIAPGKPQQNGRHERMHRTLKHETQTRKDLRAQQREFDFWRREFNEERPHAALSDQPPATVYVPSSRRYPRPLIRPVIGAWSHAERVDKEGFIRVHRRKIFISSALRHLDVELERVDDQELEIRWGPIILGHYDPSRGERGLVPVRRRRGTSAIISLQPRPSER